jgi:hypothetical protein
MLLKPRSITIVGVVQFFLALSFVIWLMFFPDTGGNFAWPVTPRLTALFIGGSFIFRLFLGYHLWREKYWYRLRWTVWGNAVFLGVIFVATFWHLAEMNWATNIIVAHLWLFAYILEPVLLPFAEPRGAEAEAPVPAEVSQGALLPLLKQSLFLVTLVGITIGALFFLSSEFLNDFRRWPWVLDEFNARIMAAWPAGMAFWAARMYFLKDWAEVKMGVQGIMVFLASQVLVWIISLPQYDPTRHNHWVVGILPGIMLLVLGYCYWRQEQARQLNSRN